MNFTHARSLATPAKRQCETDHVTVPASRLLSTIEWALSAGIPKAMQRQLRIFFAQFGARRLPANVLAGIFALFAALFALLLFLPSDNDAGLSIDPQHVLHNFRLYFTKLRNTSADLGRTGGNGQPVSSLEEEKFDGLPAVASSTLTPSTPKGNMTNSKELPYCGCSTDMEDGEWVARPSGEVNERPLLRLFENWPTWTAYHNSWSNCTSEMRRFKMFWKPRNCRFWDPYMGAAPLESRLSDEALAKVSKTAEEFRKAMANNKVYPPSAIPKEVDDQAVKLSVTLASDPRLIALWANKSIAMVGDSLMNQHTLGFKKYFPLASNHLASPHNRTLLPATVYFVDPPSPFGFNISVHMVRVVQPVPAKSPIFDYLFDTAHFDVVFVNFGVWYNLGVKLDNATISNIRAGKGKGYSPMSDLEFKPDMEFFVDTLRKLKEERKKQGKWPIVIWGESPPQHFPKGTFRLSDLNSSVTNGPKVQCYEYADMDSFDKLGNWRNNIANPIVAKAGIPSVRFSKALHYLFMAHPYMFYKNVGRWGNDCTHYCEPSARTIVEVGAFVGCLKELQDKKSK